jgi:cell division septation protein DedD
VQVGSFVEVATAQRWVERLKRRNLPVWVTAVEIKGQTVNRVRVGALPTESEADGLARALKREYGWPVWVDRVAGGETLPASAVRATRAFLYGS